MTADTWARIRGARRALRDSPTNERRYHYAVIIAERGLDDREQCIAYAAWTVGQVAEAAMFYGRFPIGRHRVELRAALLTVAAFALDWLIGVGGHIKPDQACTRSSPVGVVDLVGALAEVTRTLDGKPPVSVRALRSALVGLACVAAAWIDQLGTDETAAEVTT